MKRLVIALQFLTRLPMPRVTATAEDFAASMRWFPAAGLVVGVIVAAGGWAGSRIDPWTGALVALLLWVGVTGALHLDGLGDIADAAGAAHKDRARLLAVLADPHAGSFAVATIAMQVLTKLVLLHGLIAANAFAPIALTAFAARIGPLLWSRWLPDLHAGLGSTFRGVVRPAHLLLWSATLVAAALLSPSLLLAPPILIAWGIWIKSRIGGISGDGHGAGIEIGESALLAVALGWSHIG